MAMEKKGAPILDTILSVSYIATTSVYQKFQDCLTRYVIGPRDYS